MVKVSKRDWFTIDEVAIRDYKNFRWIMFMGAFFLGPLFALMVWRWPEEPSFHVVFFWVYLLIYFVELIALYLLFSNGWFMSFVIFLISAVAGLALSFIATFFKFAHITLLQTVLWIVGSWLFLSPFMYWWGRRTLMSNGEPKEAIFRAKRIDIEAGAYSPYRVPHDLYQTKWSKFLISSYGLVLTLALVVAGTVSHFVSSRNMDPNRYGVVFFAYLLVPVIIYVLSGWFQEWRWIYNWEKKTGRKMYIREIIQWKQLQAKRKANRPAAEK